jgi:hypothetical protein
MYLKKKIFPALIIAIFLYSGCGRPGPSSPPYRLKADTKQTNIPAQTADRKPPLIEAAILNNAASVKNLLRAGADINVKDAKGKSALWYAFEHENPDAFKVLVEHGANIDFDLSYEAASRSYPKMKLYKLVKEYNLFYRIKSRMSMNGLMILDAYLSEFPNGYYVSEIEKILEDIVRSDYSSIRNAAGAGEWEQFLEKYSRLGQNCYMITANGLNVRAAPVPDARRVGTYIKGDRIFAVSKREGWIQTDRGWISADYAKQIPKTISVLQPYIRKAEQKLKTVHAALGIERSADAPRQPKIIPHQPEEAEFPASEIRDQKTVAAEKELEELLRHATLPKLEAFINKYKDDSACRSLVIKAREKYKSILLNDM